MKHRWAGIILFGFVLLGPLSAWGQGAQPSTETADEAAVSAPPIVRRVAVTIDDLPVADVWQHESPEARRAIVAGLCDVIRSRSIPVVGFFNMSRSDDDPHLVQTWIDCGVQLGNHTWSHPRLREVEIDEYLADLERGHRAIQEVVGQEARIHFRYPYLEEGFSHSDRDAIRTRLAELGSPIAPVTIDTWDWLYSRGYTVALREGDQALADRYLQSWRWDIEEKTEYAEALGRELFGREPAQILLLHGNQINAEHLGEVLDWFTERGYQFVTLDEALEDPAYTELDVSLSPTGDSHWLRLRRTRQLAAE